MSSCAAWQSYRPAAWLTHLRMRQLWYVPLLGLAMGLMMARTLLMARLLEVRSFADFSGAILISSSFCMLGCLGLQTTLQRDWPANIWHGQELRGLMRAAQCNLVAVACAVVLIAAVLFGVRVSSFSPLLLIVGIVHGCAQQIFVIATVESRSRGDALRFSWENVLRALCVISVGFVVAVWTGSALHVLLAEAVLTLSISIGLFRRSALQGRLTALSTYLVALRQMPYAPWGAAMMLLAITSGAFLLVNIDRWIAAAGLGPHEFAAYSFAWTVPMLAQSIQQILNTSVFPSMARRFGAGAADGAFRLCAASSVLIMIGGTIASVPAFFVLKHGVHSWFPKYANAVVIVPVFLAVAVLRVSEFWSSFLVAVRREGALMFANVIAASAGVLGWWLWIRTVGAAPLRPLDVAVLALVLSATSYLASMSWAWKARVDQLRLEVTP